MKIVNVLNKKISLLALTALFSTAGFAQGATGATPGGFSISTNTSLAVAGVILLVVILLLTSVVSKAADFLRNNSKAVSVLLLLMLTGISVHAQDAQAATTASSGGFLAGNTAKILLIVLIVVELVIIGYLVMQIRTLTGKMAAQAGGAVAEASLWDKINSFKPLEEEEKIDIGHSYDGIRELDNIAPPWFTIGFAFTILFAVVYLYRYHISKTAPLQIEEYEIAVQDAKAHQTVPEKTVDVDKLVLLDADGIAKGKELFTKNCIACHANDGGGNTIGPNLTDDYWIHGGSLKNIYVSIRDGYPDKGMTTWSAVLNPEQIEQVTSFVKSLKGTTPAAPKEPQGDLYTE
jgi:cytochrome c oxidase cbb3-type subunit 3